MVDGNAAGPAGGADALQSLFEIPVWACVADAAMYAAPDHWQDWPAIGRAVPKRRREFVAGRAAARGALRRMGIPAAPIPRMANGCPQWPDGVIGSITHTEGYCAAVVGLAEAAAGIGLDAEVGGELPSELLPLIATPAELAFYDKMPTIDGADWGKLLFSAKEAFYKSVYPARGQLLDFIDVTIVSAIDAGRRRGEFQVIPAEGRNAFSIDPADFKGRWQVEGSLIFCGATFGSYR
jgi:4'-phosphopantetheinyl transferase EntD